MRPPLRQGSPDDFQTPPEALEPLLPYLKEDWTIWECAAGKGFLADELENKGFEVIATDKYYDADGDIAFDFLLDKPVQWDCIITNPPFSLKQKFLERCYGLGTPFALLLPLTTFETIKRQELFKKYGLEVIFMPKRVNFETPNKVEKSSSWFATAWFTNGLNIGKQMTFSKSIKGVDNLRFSFKK